MRPRNPITAPAFLAESAANGGTIVLTSINACETTRTDLPDDFYLTNATRPASTKGRLQSWPGAFRLDLTNPAVQEWQAELMYGLVAFGGVGRVLRRVDDENTLVLYTSDHGYFLGEHQCTNQLSRWFSNS